MKVGTLVAICAAAIIGVCGVLWHYGLGNSAVDGEATGQAKKLTSTTPVLCENYRSFDMSMGVMRNGTGSMSTQDMWFTVYSQDPKLLQLMKEAVEHNLIVKVTYNTRRAPACTEAYILTGVEIVKD